VITYWLDKSLSDTLRGSQPGDREHHGAVLISESAV
jgi:hypothetical protein